MVNKYTMAAMLLVFLSATGVSQTVQLSGPAKFILQDRPEFAQALLDEQDWISVHLPASWSSLGITQFEKKIGWYRIHFKAPTKLIDQSCLLFAGLIDDADETFLNGVKIGNTGIFPPNDQSAWDAQRKYQVPKGLLKTENVLAIRVYNGILDAGLYGGKLFLTTAKEYERYLKKKQSDLHSYHQLSTSNGLAVAVYNEEKNLVEHFYTHIFSYHDSAQAVLPAIQNIQPNLSSRPQFTRYHQNTHVIEVAYRHCTLYYFCAFSKPVKALYVWARGKTQCIDSLDFSYDQGFGAASMKSAQRTFGGQSEKLFVFTCSDALNPAVSAQLLAEEGIKGELLSREVSWMRNEINQCTLPTGLSKLERNVAEQSLSILKMAQVADAEVYPLAGGQILASLRPGVWAISWVRDAAFAIEAMSSTGMFDEARKGLEFMLKAAPSGQYVRYVHTDGKDYGVGVPYQISVTRYFGNGREESDFAPETGPNIELDDFGLFLIAFCHYVNESQDKAFFQTWRALVKEKVLKPIVHNLDQHKILRQDSGPWEHHLPGRQYVFTNGVCARGMQLFCALERRFAEPDLAMEAVAIGMISGLDEQFLVDGRFYKGNAQEFQPSDHYYFDAATFELFACGLVDNKPLFQSHMHQYNQHLRAAKDPARGYIRFDSQDSYENQEWPFAGLRVAVAAAHFSERQTARQLIDRITRFASRNHNQIPEIIGLEELDYRGAIPMVGYGAGAYLLALKAYYTK
jgi:hypothetical protein